MRVGIVGGTGELGRSIADALLANRVVAPDRLWISNRSGGTDHFPDHPGVHVTTSPQELADACEIVLLSVPPASAASIAMEARRCLVISVMAGISIERLSTLTRADRIIRAMSSPAARHGLAYSPWCASTAVTADDREKTTALFEACGLTDEVGSEAHIECFTAMTGPVPGFVAFFAKAMVDYATSKGIAAETADRAIRQLFLGAGTLMSVGEMTPADHVRQMIDYAGTTAAGLETLERSSVSAEIAKGLDASVERTRALGGSADP